MSPRERSCMNNESLNCTRNYGDIIDDDITDDDITEDISETDYDSTTTDEDSTTTSTDDDDDDNRYIILDLDFFTVTRENNYITLEYDESNKKKIRSKCKKFFRSSKILKEMILMDTEETQCSKKRKIDDTSYDIFEEYTETNVLENITKCILDDDTFIFNMNEETVNVIFLSFFTFNTKYCVCRIFFTCLKQMLYYYHNMMTKDQQSNWKRYLIRHQKEIKRRMICSLKLDPINHHPEQLNCMKIVTKTVCFMSADKTGLLPELIDIKQMIRKLLEFSMKVLERNLSLSLFKNYVNYDDYSRNGYFRFVTLLRKILCFNSSTLGLNDSIRKQIKLRVKKYAACKKNVTSAKRCLNKFCQFAEVILENCDNKN